jgi:hypothetical protein
MATAGRMQVSKYVTVTASKWYPHTSLILSLAFQNLTSKATAFKEFCSKQRIFGFQNIYSKTLSCLIKRFQNSKLCENKLWFWSKSGFQKEREREILKSFAPLRTFGLFEMFLKPYPYFKVLCEKGISNHLYVYFKNFEKRRFSSNSVFKSAFL